MRERRGDERRQRRANRRDRRREPLVEGLTGTCQNCDNSDIVTNLGKQYSGQVEQICKTRNSESQCTAAGGQWQAAGPGGDVAQSSDSFNPSCPPPTLKPQVPPPAGGAGQGPPYLSYDCLNNYCTQVPRATGTYWTSNCDGNCPGTPPPAYPGYGPNGYPNRGPPGGPIGPQYCPP